ncbi:MAG: glycosyltransferase family 39 protein, partial [Anaerolineae bacterium]
MAENDRAGGLLFIIALALGALGQFYLTYRRQYVWDGVLFWTASIVLLGLALQRVRRIEQGAAVRAKGTRLPWLWSMWEHPGRTLMAVGGAGLSIAAGWLARERFPNADFADLLFLWIVGVAGFLLAFSPSLPTWPELWGRPVKDRGLGHWLRRNRVELAGLVVLLVVALAVRAYDLEHIPANLGGDEGTQGAEALELVGSPMGNPFSTGWFSVPTMSFLVYGVSMRVLGATVGGLRTLSALIGAATVLTTFLLGRELWGDRVAWLSASVLASAHYHIHFSRLGSNQIADGLFVTLGLWLLIRALRTRRAMAFAATGAVVGFGWYGYFGARLVGVIVACYLGLQVVSRHRFLARHGRLLAIVLVTALVVAAPLLLHYTAHPADLLSRPRQVSIFASGWLAREREIT